VASELQMLGGKSDSSGSKQGSAPAKSAKYEPPVYDEFDPFPF